MNDELLKAHIGLCVPLRIHEIQQEGQPLSEHFARIQPYAQRLGEFGDHLLFRGGKTTEMANILVDSIAVLSFVPGGITLFGMHFETEATDA